MPRSNGGCRMHIMRLGQKDGFVYEPLPGIQEESEREVEDHTPNMPAEERLSSTPSSTYSYESDRSSTYRENVPSAGSGRWREEDYVLVPPAQPSRSHADVSMTGSTRQTDEQSWVHIRSVDTDGQKRTLGRLVNESSASTNIGLIHPQPLVTTTSSLLAALDELQNAGNLPPTSTSHQTGSLATGSSLPTTGEWNAIFSTPPFALCENGTPAAYGPPFQPIPIAHATQTHPGTVWPPIAQNGAPASAEGNATHTYGHQTRNGALGNLNIQDRGTVSRELSRPTQRAWDNSSQGGMPNGEVREMPWIDPRYDPNSSGSWGQYNGAYAY
ncbi:hypothetical protein D9611_011401 [Ephemerocybe angulata]|uniref:Uncharacterized protein n=1 Tax=Ephemerocybe angulata TaxID=980116 RepID=A0A8H5CDR4_9AGAR|nr:hypothetical protein D9611_011401 [Tulosesus angulatus]